MGSSASRTRAGSGPSREPTKVKLVFVGDERVGKTCLVKRLAGKEYVPEYQATIGVEYETLDISRDPYVRFHLWDTAGQPRFRSLATAYARDARALVFVYDTSNRESFLNLRGQPVEIGAKVGAEHIVMIVGTKIDLPRGVAREEAAAFAVECGALCVELSARTGEGIGEFTAVLMKELSRRRWIPPGWASPVGSVEDQIPAAGQRFSAPPPAPCRPRPPEAVPLAAPARASAEEGTTDREFANAVADELKCVICLEPAMDAFELSCCHKLVCAECERLVRRGGGCPHCRAAVWRLEAAVLARRLLGSLPARCGWCGVGVQRGNLRAHEEGCAAARVRCSAVGCDFEGLRSEFAEHVAVHG